VSGRLPSNHVRVNDMGLKERSEQRRKRIIVHRAASHEEAEQWDLEYWQQRTPQERLSALTAIIADVSKVRRRRK